MYMCDASVHSTCVWYVWLLWTVRGAQERTEESVHVSFPPSDYAGRSSFPPWEMRDPSWGDKVGHGTQLKARKLRFCSQCLVSKTSHREIGLDCTLHPSPLHPHPHPSPLILHLSPFILHPLSCIPYPSATSPHPHLHFL